MYEWVDQMTKEIEDKKPKNESNFEFKEEDLDKIADRVINKLSEVSTPKSKNKENDNKENDNKENDNNKDDDEETKDKKLKTKNEKENET